MNKIDKYLHKLPPKEREMLNILIDQIECCDLINLDIKKLKGYFNSYRVRKGNTRIIFHFDAIGRAIIDSIQRRSDNMY
jgi:mRNA-degrading endonuclease RelE of RelBE toxin-antitoxin system